MKDIAIYTLTSELHDAEAVGNMTNDFLASLQTEYDLKGDNFADYGMHTLNLIFVRTGGTEGIFKRLLPQLQALSGKPVYLLTSGKSNSLAASMEILSYLRQNNLKGEIIHGSADYIQRRINLLANAGRALKQMDGSRLGIVGKPSDWLISSSFDRNKVRERLGILLEDIDMQELLDVVSSIPVNDKTEEAVPSETIGKALPGALRIYEGLKQIVGRHQLQGFTIRCFDLLTALRNTGCIALAKLNAEGIVSGCEGDVPAMISMKIAQALTGLSGFQANPASINPETGEITFAHCTIGHRCRHQGLYERGAVDHLQSVGRLVTQLRCRRRTRPQHGKARPLPHTAGDTARRTRKGCLLPDQSHRQPPHHPAGKMARSIGRNSEIGRKKVFPFCISLVF